MTPDQAFSLANGLAPFGWLLLIAIPRWRWTLRLTQYLLPAVFALLYITILAFHLKDGDGGFGSLTEVQKLFANPWALAGGWIHYLAFDLFTGSWLTRDGLARGISRWLLLPCQLLTFLFGPAGLLLYLAVLRRSLD